MDIEKVGKAIAYLRKRAGLTQKDLADRIGISDKAVSKWERGIGLPDISYFGKLSILLDTDMDSLLAGDVIHHDKDWNGLLVLPQNPYGIGVDTMIYDKPLVYFLLSYFLLVGVKTIFVVCSKGDKSYMLSEFGDGSKLGISLHYCEKRLEDISESFEKNMSCSNLMVVFGRSFIYGVDQTRFFQKAMFHKDHLTILSLPKKIDTSHFASDSAIYFNDNMRIVSLDSDEIVKTQYDYHEIPVVFCPKNRLSELSCIDENGDFSINLSGCRDEMLYTELLDRGYVEIPIDTPDDVIDVSNFVRMLQKACGMRIYCIEEIAWRRGMISLETLKKYGEQKEYSDYGKYILSLCARY